MKSMLWMSLLVAGIVVVAPAAYAEQTDPQTASEEPGGTDRPQTEATSRSARAWWAASTNRGWLGVRMSSQSEAKQVFASTDWPEMWTKIPNLQWLAEKWDGEGALLVEIFPDTPAGKAGLLAGDVIVSFNGIRTASPGVLSFVVQRVVVGHDANIEILRDDARQVVLAEISMHPEDARRLEEQREAARQAESPVEP